VLRDWKLEAVLGNGERREMYEVLVMRQVSIRGMPFGVGTLA